MAVAIGIRYYRLISCLSNRESKELIVFRGSRESKRLTGCHSNKKSERLCMHVYMYACIYACMYTCMYMNIMAFLHDRYKSSIGSFIHSGYFYTPYAHYYPEVLPTQHGYCARISHRSAT